ncbi:MAG TPA: transposase [Candidatus Binataceae bacterium]|nr:transposase [Candidatus Binataceae bacterium]
MRLCNKRGTAEQWINETRQAVKMTRLSAHCCHADEVRRWLSVIAYNLGHLYRRSALPTGIGAGSLTSLRQGLQG